MDNNNNNNKIIDVIRDNEDGNNIKINIALSLAVVAVLIVAALAGWMSLTTGLLLNEGSAALIILNGLRMLAPGRGETHRKRITTIT